MVAEKPTMVQMEALAAEAVGVMMAQMELVALVIHLLFLPHKVLMDKMEMELVITQEEGWCF